MATLLQSIAAGSRKADGSANAGGRVFLTSPGTDIPVTAYQDRDKTAQVATSNAGYLLGADGRAFLWIDVPCQVREETSDGTLVAFYSAGSDVAAGLVEVKNAGFTGTMPDGTQGAGGRTYLDVVLSKLSASLGPDCAYLIASNGSPLNLKDWMTGVHVNVKAFGAVGNGVADDTTAIQNAINFVQSLGGGIVHFPSGTYLVSSTVAITKTGVTLEGSGSGATVLKLTVTNADTVSVAVSVLGKGEVDVVFSNIVFTVASSTSGTAINATAGGLMLDRCGIQTGFRNGITFAGIDASINVLNASVVFSSDNAGSAIKFSGNNDALFISNSLIAGVGATTVGITMSGTLSTIQMSSSQLSAIATAASIGANVGDFRLSSTLITSGVITDARISSPYNYSLAVNTTVTLLPLQSDSSRIVATAAAITVTLAAIGTTGWGRQFRLICSNASGGAVTWTFNAQFVLSAAVNPATGNRINLLLEYNPVDNKVYEIARAATAN